MLILLDLNEAPTNPHELTNKPYIDAFPLSHKNMVLDSFNN